MERRNVEAQDAREHRGPDAIDHAVHCLLTVRDEQRPWSVHEIGLEIGDQVDAHDAIRHLQGAGLAHELGGFVWATRAALLAEAMND
jgi:hypothetical protein